MRITKNQKIPTKRRKTKYEQDHQFHWLFLAQLDIWVNNLEGIM